MGTFTEQGRSKSTRTSIAVVASQTCARRQCDSPMQAQVQRPSQERRATVLYSQVLRLARPYTIRQTSHRRGRQVLERFEMYAVIKTGGKQYRVATGEKVKVESLKADVGAQITLDQVLAVGNGAEMAVGTPLLAGASVVATVVAHGRHDKVRIFKMRRRKHYQKRQGHRQGYTEIEIGAVNA